MCLSEKRKVIRLIYLCSCGTKGSQALLDLLDPFPGLSLLCQCPAAQNSTHRPPVRKSLVRGKADGGFCTILGETYLAAELMDHGSNAQGKTEAKGVCNLLRQGQRLIVPCQPLVRIAKVPQRPGGMAAAHHTRVLP